ncbi:MAG: response regulator [Elusimicrobiota bacterium]
MDPFSVLLVDDEVEYLNTLVKRIKKRGIDVRSAGSAEEAIRLLEQRPVDVVVMDVKMPGMGGIEALKEIKRKHPLTEVIMLTGHANVDVAMEGMRLGAFDYLMKPLEIDELLYKLEDAHKKRSIELAKIKRGEADQAER